MSGSVLQVSFDVTPVISGRTGIARYVTQLIAALEQLSVEVRRFAIGRNAFPVPPETAHIRVPARLVERWWRTVPWPVLERLAGDADLIHASGLLIPRTRGPLVVTVHDIAGLRHPELHPARHVRQQRALLAALPRASAVITVSQTTADDLADLGIASERIFVAPLGLTPLPPPAAITDSERVGHGYLLTVGETSPRKNYSVVLRALARLEKQQLVIAGPSAGDETRLQSQVAALGISSRITRLGVVSDATLAGLYGGALALCFPSVAEGFGLPVLEAMAAGLPVIASDIPATRELASDAAVYVNGDGEQAWADAIDALAADSELRARLAAAGRARAAQFTWERTATATLDAYRLALAAAAAP